MPICANTRPAFVLASAIVASGCVKGAARADALETRTDGAPASGCPARTDGLPRDYPACVALDPASYPDGGMCWASWCEGEALFDACRRAGGGLIATEGAPPLPATCCKVIYPEGKCPCFGNYCD